MNERLRLCEIGVMQSTRQASCPFTEWSFLVPCFILLCGCDLLSVRRSFKVTEVVLLLILFDKIMSSGQYNHSFVASKQVLRHLKTSAPVPGSSCDATNLNKITERHQSFKVSKRYKTGCFLCIWALRETQKGLRAKMTPVKTFQWSNFPELLPLQLW